MALAELKPEWLAEGVFAGGEARMQMGINFLCPFHEDEHRLSVWFVAPYNGGPPRLNVALYRADTPAQVLSRECGWCAHPRNCDFSETPGSCGMLESLTIVDLRDELTGLEFPGHGRLWILGGAVVYSGKRSRWASGPELNVEAQVHEAPSDVDEE